MSRTPDRVRPAAAAVIVPLLLALACVGAQARGLDVSGDALVHADATRALGYTGKGVTVALLDTGIDDLSPDFAGAVVAEHCIVPPAGCPGGAAELDGPGSADDDQGHGTAIAGIVAGRGVVGPIGVAPAAALVVVKVADHNGRTSAGQIAAGLDWVRVHHPEAKVVNLSLAGDIPLVGDCSALTASLKTYAGAVDALRAQGTTVFAASGNNGAHFGIPAPACFPGTVAVGAVYSRAFGSFTAPNICRDTATGADQVACFSNGSTELDLLAVGAPVGTIGLDSEPEVIAGTSAAAAQASGAAAVLLQADPQLTPDRLEGLLESTGVPLTDLRSHFTTPRIDVAAALGAILGRAVPLVPPPGDDGPVTAPKLSTPTIPRVEVSATRISFDSVKRGHDVVRKLVVSNVGTGYLDLRVATSLAAVTVAPAKLTIRAGQRRTVVLTFRPTRTGRYQGRVRLATNDPARPTVAVPMSGVGRA